jgi:hypothetical protein
MGQPKLNQFDIIVAGGGPSGLVAATAAARLGARTLIIEQESFLGGNATSALINKFFGFFVKETRVVRGIPEEFTERIKINEGSTGFERYVFSETGKTPLSVIGFSFNPEVVKIVADEMVTEAGVKVLFHTHVVDVVMEYKRVAGIITEGVCGRREFRAKVILDATGDATVAKKAGAEILGEEEELKKARMPPGLIFRLTDIDLPRFRALAIEEKRKLVQEGLRTGEIPWQNLGFFNDPMTKDAFCHMSRISGFDTLDDEDLSEAEMVGRRQIRKIITFLRREVPGFEHCKLAGIATRAGVRETRRIVGLYTLTEQDIYEARHFQDGMALGAGYIDLHDHTGPGILIKGMENPTQIPMRCLLPISMNGLVVTGRAISSTRLANSAIRQMGTAMALGQAAGTLAAVAVRRSLLPTEVSAAEVQRILRENGAVISQQDIC